MLVSLNPNDAVAGGLLADVNVTFEKVRFDMFDYGGSQLQAVPAIHATMVTDDGESAEQYWSVGSAKDWMPNEDGTGLESVGTATQLRQGSNGVIFFENLVSAGFPGDRLANDISILDGLKAHVMRIPAPVRAGLKKKEDDREQTILVVDEVLQLPWEAEGAAAATQPAKAKGKGKATGKPATPPADPDAVNGLAEQAEDIVMAFLSDSDAASVPKKSLATHLYTALKGNDDRTALINLIGSEDFLGGERPWKYDNGEISIG